MTPGEWISVCSVSLGACGLLYSSHRDLKHTIQSLFIERLERIEEEDKLRDEWIQDVQNKADDVTGKIKIVEFRLDMVEKNCGVRHDQHGFPGGAL